MSKQASPRVALNSRVVSVLPSKTLPRVLVTALAGLLISCVQGGSPKTSPPASGSNPTTSLASANNPSASPASKKPAAVILALKKEGQNECTIDTSLTAMSNDKGEVLIPNVKSGEYVVFQSPAGTVNPALNGKVVTWSPSANGYSFSFGAATATKGNMVITPEGNIGIANGYMEGQVVDGTDGILGMTTTAKGALMTVRVVESTNEIKLIVNADGTLVDATSSGQKAATASAPSSASNASSPPPPDSVSAAAAGDERSPAATTPPPAPGPGKWYAWSSDQKHAYMKEVVMPKMGDLFRTFDVRHYADPNCAMCHGPSAKKGDFKMPNSALSALIAADQFKSDKVKHPKAFEFMMKQVEPRMAALIGEPPYDPKTKKGFGCFNCHTKKCPCTVSPRGAMSCPCE